MKKHISFLLLFARATIFPMIALLAVMAAVELTIFCRSLDFHIRSADAVNEMDSLEKLLDYSNIDIIFGLAFLVLTVLLCLPGCRLGSRTDYTFSRLSLDERTIFWWQTGYNAACYLMLWAAQLAVTLACCSLYFAHAPEHAYTAQSLYLAAYRSPLLHALLPLDDLFLWLRNLGMLAGLALSTARVPLCRRQGRAPIAVVIMALTMYLFPRALGSSSLDAITLWPIVGVISGTLWAVLHKEDEDEA